MKNRDARRREAEETLIILGEGRYNAPGIGEVRIAEQLEASAAATRVIAPDVTGAASA